MTDDLIARLRSGQFTEIQRTKNTEDITYPSSAGKMAADALEAQARRIAELEAELETTKSLLPQKLDEAPYRPPFISDWWSIAVLERRKRRNVDKELRARIAELEERVDAFEMDAGHAATRIAELKAALKPFDEMLQRDFSFMADDERYDDDFTSKVLMRLGDLRAARAAYLGEKE